MADENSNESTDVQGAVVEGQNQPDNQPDALGVPGSQHDPDNPAVPTDTLPWTADAPNEPAATAVTDVVNTPEAASLSEPTPWYLHTPVGAYIEGLKAEIERTTGKAKAEVKKELDRVLKERAVKDPKETA